MRFKIRLSESAMCMEESKRMLFLGVSGAGMAPLAMWCAQAGGQIFGYDDNCKESVSNFLRRSKVNLLPRLLVQSIVQYDTVVYSSALSSEHRLLVEARRLGIPCLRRGELLAAIAESKKLIAVVGSHGKTSTCALIAHAIQKLALGHNFILGGFFQDQRMPFQHSDSEWLLAEIDESDGTINDFNPEITILLNLDWDHCDYYKNLDSLKDTFAALIERTQGCTLIDAETRASLIDRLPVSAKLDVEGDKEKFQLVDCVLEPIPRHQSLGRAAFSNTEFNQSNRAFALALLKQFQKVLPEGVDLFEDFPGVDRRQKSLILDDQLTVIEDYAHHPREIAVLLRAIEALYPESALTLVFQPHRFSRTEALCTDFIQVLDRVENLFILPVYSAFESRKNKGDSSDLWQHFTESSAQALSLDGAGLQTLSAQVRERAALGHQVVLFLGAGSVNEFAHAFCSNYRFTDSSKAWLDYTQKKVSPQCLLKLDEALANKTTFKIGGAARQYAEPAELSDIFALIRSARFFNLDFFCLGRGSNLLVSDSGYAGLVLRLRNKAWQEIEILDDRHLWVSAGVRTKELCGFAAEQGFSGLEFLEGIPGSLGGALRMNAGAMGCWTFDIVERVLMVNASQEIVELARDAFTIEYRKVREIADGIALGAVLKLGSREGRTSVRNRMDSYSDVRKESQPIAPSAGCIFKNPNKDYAGRLIDELGLKNLSVGGAEVSEVHGNFIVNRGHSSASDVRTLIALIQERVKAETGIELEPEILYLGEDEDAFSENSQDASGMEESA